MQRKFIYLVLTFLLLCIVLFDACDGQGSTNDANGEVTQRTNEDILQKESAAHSQQIIGFTYLNEESFTCAGLTNALKCFRHDRTGLLFVLVPGGTFLMGSSLDKEDVPSDFEIPQHSVTVKPFLICRTECTQRAWDRVNWEDHRTWYGPSLPIERISWWDCMEWCRKAGLRLPTEAEWEYACRAGTTGRYSFGDSDADLGDYAWYGDNSDKRTHPVALKKPNAFGLFDMHGNVVEWCQDTWHENYFEAPTDGSAWKDEDSTWLRVGRGGCWVGDAKFCRSAERYRGGPGYRSHVGFRPACSLPETE